MERTPHPTRARSGLGRGPRAGGLLGSWEWAFGPQQQLSFYCEAQFPNEASQQSVPIFQGARLALQGVHVFLQLRKVCCAAPTTSSSIISGS